MLATRGLARTVRAPAAAAPLPPLPPLLFNAAPALYSAAAAEARDAGRGGRYAARGAATRAGGGGAAPEQAAGPSASAAAPGVAWTALTAGARVAASLLRDTLLAPLPAHAGSAGTAGPGPGSHHAGTGSSPLLRPDALLQRGAYVASQAARVTFFTLQYLASMRMLGPQPHLREQIKDLGMTFPSAEAIYESLAQLFKMDLRNIEAGLYKGPLARPPPDLLRVAAAAADYFRDLPVLNARRARSGRREVEVETESRVDRPTSTSGAPGAAPELPSYFTQNFHWQSGGYLSDDSAIRYDYQVEVLFGGSADAMRRVLASAPLAEALRAHAAAGAAQGPARWLDVACGTGRFLRDTFRELPPGSVHATALDLSPNYLRHARDSLRLWQDSVEFVHAAVEAMPLADDSIDVATCIFLLHELPPLVRAAALTEISRVLKPGGRLILVDSIQFGDYGGAWDGFIRLFPTLYHEPVYLSYAQQDIGALAQAAGLELAAPPEAAHLSKRWLLTKPQRARAVNEQAAEAAD